MSERIEGYGSALPDHEEDRLSRSELQIEQEKLRLERDRILLEQERLRAVQERLAFQEQSKADERGNVRVSLSTLVLTGLVALLAGGMIGVVSTTIHHRYQNRERLRQVMDTLAVNPVTETVSPSGVSNRTESAVVPAWLKRVQPKDTHAGISLVIIQ